MTQINKIDTSNVKELLNIIEANGYPSETEIGLCDSVNYFHNFDLIIWHQNYKEDQIFNFEYVIKKALKEGRINQDYGGFLIEKCQGRNTYWVEVAYKVIPIGLLKEKYSEVDYLDLRIKNAYLSPYINRIEIDALRSTIGLRPISEYLKILKFKLKQNKFGFIVLPKVKTASYLIEDEETFKFMILQSEVIQD